MDIKILPLAITMMAGPQILFAILLVTQDNPVKLSLAYFAAIAIAATIGVTISSLIVSFLGTNLSSGSNSDTGKIIEIGLVILLIFLSIRTYINRKNIKEPKWMTSLENINARKVFTVGLPLVFFMPTDLVAMITVGTHLFSENLPITAAIPFLLLTLMIASLPLLTYLLFKNKAKVFMPKVRDWMEENGAIVNIAVYLFFIFLILK